MTTNAPISSNIDKLVKFKLLQEKLIDRWQPADYFDQQERHILVVPSLSLVQEEL